MNVVPPLEWRPSKRQAVDKSLALVAAASFVGADTLTADFTVTVSGRVRTFKASLLYRWCSTSLNEGLLRPPNLLFFLLFLLPLLQFVPLLTLLLHLPLVPLLFPMNHQSNLAAPLR